MLLRKYDGVLFDLLLFMVGAMLIAIGVAMYHQEGDATARLVEPCADCARRLEERNTLPTRPVPRVVAPLPELEPAPAPPINDEPPAAVELPRMVAVDRFLPTTPAEKAQVLYALDSIAEEARKRDPNDLVAIQDARLTAEEALVDIIGQERVEQFRATVRDFLLTLPAPTGDYFADYFARDVPLRNATGEPVYRLAKLLGEVP